MIEARIKCVSILFGVCVCTVHTHTNNTTTKQQHSNHCKCKKKKKKSHKEHAKQHQICQPKLYRTVYICGLLAFQSFIMFCVFNFTFFCLEIRNSGQKSKFSVRFCIWLIKFVHLIDKKKEIAVWQLSKEHFWADDFIQLSTDFIHLMLESQFIFVFQSISWISNLILN